MGTTLFFQSTGWGKTTAIDIIVILDAYQLVSGFVCHVLESPNITIDYVSCGWIPTLDNVLQNSAVACQLKSFEPIAPEASWWFHYGMHSMVHKDHPKRAATCQRMPVMDVNNYHCWSCTNQRKSNTHWMTQGTMASNTHTGFCMTKTTWTQKCPLECILAMLTTYILYYRQSMANIG